MLHVTCDLCGKELRPGEDQRFVVRIEAYAADDLAEITDADLDEDHVETVAELLRESQENSDLELAEPYKEFRYDLCSDCHKRFVRDPMSRDKESKFDFSKN